MTLEDFLGTYGYVAVLVGTFIEGETILVLGGFAAHLGFLKLPWVIAAAFAGTLSGDQLYFYLGRKHKDKITALFPTGAGRIEKAQRTLERHGNTLMLTFRFLYGLRTVTPFVIGMTGISAMRFFFFNVLSALIWSIAVGSGGYLFGRTLEYFLADVRHYEFATMAVIALVGLLVWMIYFYRRRHSKGPPAAGN
ncbi:MAG TPA: DedA family protein [Syntrophales bacterium]|jgi:membrane protein DedA with SNARE-associated domain|nr:DedA family protein [Syntrophales bacterium]HRT62398.1 DedA family protein [Syntrophales bacterium]